MVPSGPVITRKGGLHSIFILKQDISKFELLRQRTILSIKILARSGSNEWHTYFSASVFSEFPGQTSHFTDFQCLMCNYK